MEKKQMPNYNSPIENKRSYRNSGISIYLNERYYLMSGEILEDYFRHLFPFLGILVERFFLQLLQLMLYTYRRKFVVGYLQVKITQNQSSSLSFSVCISNSVK